ncbi:MAG: hypothetical protein QXE01_06170 [Sulfolobales archaeon]
MYITNASQTLRGFPGSIAINAASVVAIAIFIGILVLLVLYLISITTPPRIAREAIPKIRVDKIGVEDLPSYVYPGIKKILREIYVSIRERFCKDCTPRELAYRRAIPNQFADLYERVVYGDIYEEGVLERLAEMGFTVRERREGDGG